MVRFLKSCHIIAVVAVRDHLKPNIIKGLIVVWLKFLIIVENTTPCV